MIGFSRIDATPGAALLVLVLTLGCGDYRPATYPVSGTVSFPDGQPVRFGTVQFIPDESGASARGQIDMNGRFELGTYANDDGATAGDHRVIIVQHVTAPIDDDVHHATDHEPGNESSLVDIRYSQLELSPLAVTVEELDNRVNLRVERAENANVSGLSQPGR